MNNFRKALAIVLALTSILAFSSCGKNEETATEAETTAFVTEADATTVEETETVEESSESEESSEAEETEETSAEAEETTAAEAEATTAQETTVEETTEATKGLNSTNIEEVVAYYNAAHANTKNAPKGHQTMKLDGEITGDGAIGALLKVLSPIAKSALERNSTDTDYVPGHPPIKASDVKSAKATSSNGVTTIDIQLKDQTDGPSASDKDGPVGRGVGTLGNIEKAVDELGGSIESGRDTAKLTYNNAYIKATIDENTNTVTGGTWHHLVNVHIGDANVKLKGLPFHLQNIKAKVDYTVKL